jgi:mannose-6-phosphate isomerase
MPEKIVKKPWGQEVWLAYPPDHPYVMKKITTIAPHRSSVHVHHKKHETNYVISGKGEVHVRTFSQKKPFLPETTILELGPGSVFHIVPETVHRVIAVEDMTTIEVSTPEVDDVVRLADDTGRGDGRIESEHL